MRNQSLISPNNPEVTISFWSVFLQTLIPIRTEQFTHAAFLLFSSFSSQGTAEKGFPIPLPLPGGFLMRRQDKNKGALRVTAPLGNSSRGSHGLLSAMQPAPTRHQLQEGQSPLSQLPQTQATTAHKPFSPPDGTWESRARHEILFLLISRGISCFNRAGKARCGQGMWLP